MALLDSGRPIGLCGSRISMVSLLSLVSRPHRKYRESRVDVESPVLPCTGMALALGYTWQHILKSLSSQIIGFISLCPESNVIIQVHGKMETCRCIKGGPRREPPVPCSTTLPILIWRFSSPLVSTDLPSHWWILWLLEEQLPPLLSAEDAEFKASDLRS